MAKKVAEQCIAIAKEWIIPDDRLEAARGDPIRRAAGLAQNYTASEIIQAIRERATDETREWHPIKTAPKNEMFIWAYRHANKGWSIGLAYRNVMSGWSDAYGDQEAPAKATHWASLPDPPR
jgi:hypothetical protein